VCVDVPNRTFNQVDGVRRVHWSIPRVSPIALHRSSVTVAHSRSSVKAILPVNRDFLDKPR
jgi:hypothetical protein